MQNWGRWGLADERGAVNTIDAAAVARGVAAVRENRIVSLAAPIVGGRGSGVVGRPPPQHFMLRDGGDYAAGLPERAGFGFADDWIALPTHGVTHLDALAHVWQDGLMYNGHPSTEVTSRGARKCGIDKAGPIVTRGLFVDMVPEGTRWLGPGEAITLEALGNAVEATGEALEPGDALLLRTGWLEAWQAGEADASAWPGLHAESADWLAAQDLSLVGADNIGVEAFPSVDQTCQVPLHIALLRNHGVYFAELLDLAALAAAGRASFLLVVAPLNIVGGAGSPVAPVAVL